ncbi:hypothetical protein ACS0Y7_31435 [Burkholderia gladioli]|uniref:hypothetical protein n=1 Tax=Burkholderia TaxID=32008 RepID=UPI001640D16D|nr:MULTISPECIES: hypothetical protein [Burkholderia]UEC02599.1 hypothetical protein LK462_11515 [Burkholderia vietnamiensis]
MSVVLFSGANKYGSTQGVRPSENRIDLKKSELPGLFALPIGQMDARENPEGAAFASLTERTLCPYKVSPGRGVAAASVETESAGCVVHSLNLSKRISGVKRPPQSAPDGR